MTIGEARAGSRDGGYDDGYAATSSLWGDEPGSVVRALLSEADVNDWAVLDLGCGQGRNAYHLARRGANVVGVDVSPLAIREAERRYGALVEWRLEDVADATISPARYDLVIAYGLLHCLRRDEIDPMIDKMQAATKPGGFNIVVAFNSRYQELDQAHPRLNPTLIGHQDIVARYGFWELLVGSDSDLRERHADTNVWHVHSMTRILARNRSV